MRRADNPFAPGAGAPPPELAGRDALRERVAIAISRSQSGLYAKSVILVGLRGVGKTVLLDRMMNDAQDGGSAVLRLEAPESLSLPAMLAPALRTVLLGLSRREAARDLAQRSLRALAGFARGMKLKYGDVEIAYDAEPEIGLADNGHLESDLPELLATVGEAARAAGTGVVMFVDEIQYVPEDQLAVLITALHRTAQRQWPVMLVGAGLPQLRGQLGRAKSYAERLFEFSEVGPLNEADAASAIAKPLSDRNVAIEDAALAQIYATTRGYPYFLQEWGKHSWDVAPESPIRAEDVNSASLTALAALDESFFLVRFDRLTPSEKRYLRAMAELGPGPHRSGDVAALLGRASPSLAPTRGSLILKGMVWSPTHGDTAFTVPLFDEFMRRTMPGDGWRA